MSKKTKKVEKKPLSPNEKKTIIIAAICVAMAIILAVSLSLVLKPRPVNPDDDGNDSNGSSTLTIKNGDFAYFDKETDSYPKTADNWTKRTYQTPEENKTHGFDEIKDDTNVVAGVVPADEDTWETVQKDLAKQGIAGTVAFPDVHADAADKNIYAIATKNATTAAIFSQTFSIASQVSAKITVWLNTEQVKNGNAVVMFQNGSGTLKADETEWHAYKTDIAKADGWVAYEFYIFNRKASSAIVVCSVGLGNCYDGTTAEGTLFIDDITYETVSANEYRKYHDGDEDPSKTNYAQIEGENTSSDIEYTNWTSGVEGTYTPEEYLTLAEAQIEGEAYSPFIKDEPFSIFKISNDGTVSTPKMLVLESWNGNDIIVASSEELKDHLHIGFWLRTLNANGNATANIILQSKNSSGDWEDVKNGNFANVETSQEIDTDKNCGFTKYDVYVKPTSATETQIRLIVVLGNKDGYAGYDQVYYPEGTLFATNPVVEEISASEYKNGTGTYAKQVSLTVGNQANLPISNGSFSNYVTTNKDQPTNWTPVFAGQNEIYRDGKGDDEIAGLVKETSKIWGGIEKNDKDNSPNKIVGDDVEKNVLKLENKVATSFGYLSSKFTLSAKSVYALSVMAKVEAGKNPYIYVVKDNPSDRTKAFLGKIETAADTNNVANDNKFGDPFFQENLDNGWVRYYMIIVTGDESVSARLALFNGSIDGTAMQEGAVYYDMASWNILGTYSVNSDKDAEVENKRDRIEFTATKGYTTFEELSDEELTAIIAESNVVSNAADWDWESIVDEAMKDPEEEEKDPDPTTETEPVNLGLLFGLLSSVALVGALLIVVVVKVFKKRNRKS
ncbi:MAG: hypothetical protein NC132_05795 [Corallococcus sp.]|nr:hypothetical protein [Corallococcus sp.]MCM1360043.1 hypothetical protein [Corallococcus sp.]MCM1395600.1 hypothetical protein [Corallococcus sp.]